MDNSGSVDPYFNRVDSPLNNPVRQTGLSFDQGFEIQARRVRLSSLIGTSQVATASGAVGSSGYAFLVTNLTPRQINNPNFSNMAIPYVTIFEGTSAVGSMEIFPQVGAGITSTPGKFICTGGFDYTNWIGTTVASLYAVTIYANAIGSASANIFAQTQWKYIQNNGGASK